MKRFALTLCLLAMLPASAGASFFDDDTPSPCVSAGSATLEATFSAPGTLSQAVVRELMSAKKSIRVAARDFTSKPVSEALVKASRAGAETKVVLDGKTNRGVTSAGQFLFTMSLIPHLTKDATTLHSDYIVIDERDVIVGDIASFIDEDEEKKTASNVLIIRGAPELAKQYLANWQTLWLASDEMKRDKN